MKIKNVFKSLFLTFLGLGGLSVATGCADDLIYEQPGKPYDGDVTIDLEFDFEGLDDGDLGSRATDGDLDFQVRNLHLFFYKVPEGENPGVDVAPAYQFSFTDPSGFVLEKREGHHCEEWTYHGKVTVDGIKGASYRVYAAANIDIDAAVSAAGASSASELTEKQLREIKVSWNNHYNGGTYTDAKSPGKHNVPDAMFGYFTTNVNDHTEKAYRNVIHHNTSLYVSKPSDYRDQGKDKDENRAQAITLDRQHLQMHAWLKRSVSKLNIGFDGSELNPGIEIYIKSVTVKDAADYCYLGTDNSIDGNAFNMINSDDDRFRLVYTEETGPAGTMAITRTTPAFPRRNDNDSKDSQDWKDYVYGDNENHVDPKYNLKPTTLYFFENLQGVDDEDTKLKSHTKTVVPEEGPSYDVPDKDKAYGTYVEVEAYYRNTNYGEKSEGKIKYRFMLGKNITNDYNTERNYHYKLLLSFIGDANNVDWHIDYEPETSLYFPIPNMSQWGQSNVWHAYNEKGEPIAEIARELVYWNPETDNDVDREKVIYDGVKRQGLIYYQIVSVYPVKKESESRYTVDMANGMVAQVLQCASKYELDDSDLKAGGKINMLLRTQVDPKLYNNNYAKVGGQSGKTVSAAKSANYAIRLLTNGNHENYDYVEVLSSDFDEDVLGVYTVTRPIKGGSGWGYSEDLEASNNTKRYRMELGNQKREALRIAPYQINDADGNIYGITKIGASYWTTEYLKSSHYFQISSDGLSTNGQGQPIYAYKPNSKTQTYQYIDKSNKLQSIEMPGVSGGYDYDFGCDEEGEEFIHFYERYPMYKDCSGIKMYNFFAATGTRGAVGSDGFEVYKKGSATDYSGSQHFLDPFYEPNIDYSGLSGEYMYLLQQLGAVNSKYYSFGSDATGYTYDSEHFDIAAVNINRDPYDYNHVFAPVGWHALPTEAGASPGNFGEIRSDHNYLEEFGADNWEHYISENPFGSWAWPVIPSSDIKHRNLSGLTLLPIPIDWETNKSFVDLNIQDDPKKGKVGHNVSDDTKMTGVVCGFWGDTLSTDFWGSLGEGFACPGFLCFDDDDYNSLCRVLYAQDYDYQYNATKSYLPIRMVRNAYDYTVQRIGAAN